MKQLQIRLQTRQQLGQIYHFLTDYNLLPKHVSSVDGVLHQITVWIEDEQLVEEVVGQLSDREFVTDLEVAPLWPANGKGGPANIRIIETRGGPMISLSRCSVYDVMDAYDDGFDAKELGETFNLFDEQVQVAIAYIEAHRERLEPELQKVLKSNTELEQYYRAIEAKRRKNMPVDSSPERQKIRTAFAEYRRKWGIADAEHPQ